MMVISIYHHASPNGTSIRTLKPDAMIPELAKLLIIKTNTYNQRFSILSDVSEEELQPEISLCCNNLNQKTLNIYYHISCTFRDFMYFAFLELIWDTHKKLELTHIKFLLRIYRHVKK